jgi:MFS transporter, PHS family, inorganic phosphate transporter
MMAAVFIMQPLGQLAAALVGLCAAAGIHASNNKLDSPDSYQPVPGNTPSDETLRSADALWRWVTGVGAIPTLVALIFRLTIPETPRYTLDIQKNINETQRNAEHQYGELDDEFDIELPDSDSLVLPEDDNPIPFSRKDLRQFFIVERNWLYLFGTSACWFLLDVSRKMSHPQSLSVPMLTTFSDCILRPRY